MSDTNNPKMLFYALWYTTFEGEKSANAISLDINSLLKLHYSSISNPECYYHKYKKSIQFITVGSIDMYIYKNNCIHKLEYFDENELNKENGAFYSSYNLFTEKENINLKEVLVYLTKEDHKVWRRIIDDNNKNIYDKNYPSFFYDNTVSHSCIIPNSYYEEGIMNAYE